MRGKIKAEMKRARDERRRRAASPPPPPSSSSSTATGECRKCALEREMRGMVCECFRRAFADGPAELWARVRSRLCALYPGFAAKAAGAEGGEQEQVLRHLSLPDILHRVEAMLGITFASKDLKPGMTRTRTRTRRRVKSAHASVENRRDAGAGDVRGGAAGRHRDPYEGGLRAAAHPGRLLRAPRRPQEEQNRPRRPQEAGAQYNLYLYFNNAFFICVYIFYYVFIYCLVFFFRSSRRRCAISAWRRDCTRT